MKLRALIFVEAFAFASLWLYLDVLLTQLADPVQDTPWYIGLPLCVPIALLAVPMILGPFVVFGWAVDVLEDKR